MRRLIRLAALAAMFAVGLPVLGQIPIPVEEQVQTFRSLPQADQQRLLRELQTQLPPAQREAIINALVSSQERPQREETDLRRDVDIDELASEIASGAAARPRGAVIRPEATLVIEFMEPATLEDRAPDPEPAQREFLDRLNDGNPYRLDGSGRLYLPAVPPIELAGLNVDEATRRLSAQRELRPFSIVVTPLPLTPVGTAALKPYGYDFFRGTTSMFAPTSDIPVPANYVIGPGDTINIQLFGNQNVQYFLRVSRDGTIDFPEIGPLNVSGLSFDDARALINERVAQQLIGVTASTTLGELRSISVLILGEVVRPGSYTISALETMTNALYRSGGFNEIGSLRRIALNRNGATVATLDLYDLLLRGDTSDDQRLQQGDTIHVPVIGETVSLVGEVRRPAIYELNGEQTVEAVIALAGGRRNSADPGAAKLERIVAGRGTSVIDLDLAVAGGQTAVRDGDVLRIEPNLDQIEGTVRLAGNVQRPALYQWREGMTVSQLLPSPELVRPRSDLNYVLIRRETLPNVEVDALSVDLQAVWEGRPGAADLTLEPRDTVYVFHLDTGRRQYVAPIVEELEAQAGPGQPPPVVTVEGEVRAEGDYPLEPGMRVSDLLRAGGGLGDGAYAREAELTRYRVVGGERREIELVAVDLTAVLAGDFGADLTLTPYDFLSVKEVSGWQDEASITLRGEFVRPGTYQIRPGETLSSVVARAGGLTEFAYPEGSIFTRVQAREREIQETRRYAQRIEADLASIDLSDQGASDALETGQVLLRQLLETEAVGRQVIQLDQIMAGRLEIDVILDDGDELFVPKLRQEVTVIGEVQYPTTHTFDPRLGRDDYLQRSGGFTRRADDNRVYIVRANGDVVTESGGRWFRRGQQVSVRPGDTIVAPIELDRIRPLQLWTGVTQVVYNMAIAAAAVNSF